MAAVSAVEQEAIDHERDKYVRMWREPVYRKFSPGEHYLATALKMLQPDAGASFIDFGVGPGRAAKALIDRGHQVIGVDIAENCLDPGLRIPLYVGDLARLSDMRADYGICCDVMEHIRTVAVDDVLREIARCAVHGVFFSISMQSDAFGMVIGEPLHLTVKDAEWWTARLQKFWPHVATEVDGANLLAACRHAPVGFSVRAEVEALCNTASEMILSQVHENSRRDLPWLAPHDVHDGHAVMVGGGASLKNDLDGIRARAAHGQTIFALNGAANFLKENGIVPDYQLVLDARPENVRLVKPRSATKYLLGSQVHPSLLDELTDCDVTLFHWGQEGILEQLPKGKKFCVLGGSYVLGPIAICAATALGFRQIHLYGYDSSDADDGAAHAYEQQQTEGEAKRLDVIVSGRKFRCSYAMFKQAEEFPAFAQMLADNGCVLTVHGDGLLPTVAREMIKQA